MLTNGGVTAHEYVKLLEDGAYSLVFADGAVAYIECTFEGNSLHSYRFFYIPSPFEGNHTVGLPGDIPLADWLRMILEDQGVQCLKSVGALRFDCVRGLPTNVNQPHPVSHLTMMMATAGYPSVARCRSALSSTSSSITFRGQPGRCGFSSHRISRLIIPR